MSDRTECERVQFELSVAHDTRRPLTSDATGHLATCDVCAAFRREIVRLDVLMAAGDISRAPDVSGGVMAAIRRPRLDWARVAAVVVVGMLIGAVTAGIGRLEAIQAQELSDRYHASSPSVLGVAAQLLVVERGWHPDVKERVYAGSLTYAAPEQMAIRLTDTTAYPAGDWIPNDVRVEFSNGDLTVEASSPCPIEALPACQEPPSVSSIRDLRPFDPGLRVPLEIVGPAASLTWWSGLEVMGSPILDGRATIQVETTVAGANLIGAITDHGAWRELHPTDRVLMWLDASTVVPVRIEVFATPSPERNLWQIRRGYADLSTQPIFIVTLSQMTTGPQAVDVDVSADARSGGFNDGPARVPEPDLPPGFALHRSGQWRLPDGGQVELASWSDGRAWVAVEATRAWTRSELFGIPSPLARPVTGETGSTLYVDPAGNAVAIHTGILDVVVSGSVSEDTLITIAASIGLTGQPVPSDWRQASVVDADTLPSGSLVPQVDGWSILGMTSGDRTTILMTGTGSRRVLITSEPGERLDPPTGPDVVAVQVRAVTGRFDASTGTLEWVESGHIIRMRSATVGREELTSLAETMTPR